MSAMRKLTAAHDASGDGFAGLERVSLHALSLPWGMLTLLTNGVEMILIEKLDLARDLMVQKATLVSLAVSIVHLEPVGFCILFARHPNRLATKLSGLPASPTMLFAVSNYSALT
jgi:hypothetical protein